MLQRKDPWLLLIGKEGIRGKVDVCWVIVECLEKIETPRIPILLSCKKNWILTINYVFLQ